MQNFESVVGRVDDVKRRNGKGIDDGVVFNVCIEILCTALKNFYIKSSFFFAIEGLKCMHIYANNEGSLRNLCSPSVNYTRLS